MKSQPLARYLRARRLERGLTQDDLARQVGLQRSAIALYETERRAVPVDAMASLASALEVDPIILERLREGVARAAVATFSQHAERWPIDGRLTEMSRHSSLRTLHDDVREVIGEGCYADLEACFLRQTPWEVAVAFQILAEGGIPLWTSPLEAGSRILSVGLDKRSYEGHLLRLAISWERDEERLLLFPQVPILVPRIEKRYRVDYLAVHASPRQPATSVIVELDGGVHTLQRGQDEVRAEDLRLPLLRYDNQAVQTPHFFSRLVRNIRDKAAVARTHNGEFSRFIRTRKARLDRASS